MPDFADSMMHLDAMLAAALRAADPGRAVEAGVRRSPPRSQRPAVIAIGKAAAAMHEGFARVYPRKHDALMVVPPGVRAPDWAMVADHPLPTARSIEAGQRVEAFVETVASGMGGCDGFVVLLSGGASSLVTLPAADVPLAGYASAMGELMASGVDIATLNCIRKHCERLKGGRLGLLMAGMPCDTYILSDVIGDDPATVASGPTVPDPTTFSDACAAFDWQLKYTRAAELLLPILRDGAAGRRPETPKPGDPAMDHCRAIVVGSNAMAVRAAADQATAAGFGVAARSGVVGDASMAAHGLVHDLLALPRPGAVVLGGETTVDVGGQGGTGGRNLELALAAAIELEGQHGIAVVSFATDGVDGPTDAAGAIVTGETCSMATRAGLNPIEALRRHDSYGFFAALDAAGHPHLLRTGPTGTNVNDLMIGVSYAG